MGGRILVGFPPNTIVGLGWGIRSATPKAMLETTQVGRRHDSLHGSLLLVV